MSAELETVRGRGQRWHFSLGCTRAAVAIRGRARAETSPPEAAPRVERHGGRPLGLHRLDDRDLRPRRTALRRATAARPSPLRRTGSCHLAVRDALASGLTLLAIIPLTAAA